MARLTWDTVSERYYETGLDRGVLYVGENPGVPWNGLVSVNEKASGGAPTPHFIDGIKFLNYAAQEQTDLTLTAVYSPPEFDVCDGSIEIAPGMVAKHQPRAEFNLSYRSKIGNDVVGSDFGYKIHLIYNALATPSDVTYQTQSDSLNVDPLSWNISTRPLVLNGFVGSAHFIFDSMKMSAGNLSYFESILYGAELSTPRMPSLEEIFEIYTHTYGVAEYGITTYP